jgi:hypothetical protein
LETAVANNSSSSSPSALAPFIYALGSSATRCEYPKGLDIFLKFAGMPGETVEERAAAFLTINDIQFYRDVIIRYHFQ